MSFDPVPLQATDPEILLQVLEEEIARRMGRLVHDREVLDAAEEGDVVELAGEAPSPPEVLRVLRERVVSGARTVAELDGLVAQLRAGGRR